MLKKIALSKYEFHDFFNDVFVKHHTYPFSKTILNNTSNKQLNTLNSTKDSFKVKSKIHYINQIPPYITLQQIDTYKSFKFKLYQGYLVDIKQFDSIESYMNKQFGSKSRSKIRSYVKRLETCFDISYKMYFGEINKNDYYNLFDALEIMIERRFVERGDEHQAANDWLYYRERFYELILNKKASLFVIYDNEKPIDINLNYHHDHVLINYIRAYDIDYSKFRLGYIDILKQLEWCFNNNHHIFDLCYGNLDYKKQWCNTVYTFENQILFYKKSIQNICIGNLIIAFYKLKVKLHKKAKLHTKTNTIDTNQEQKNEVINVNLIDLEAFTATQLHTVIDIETTSYAFLRKLVYEYLYLNFESKNNTTIFKVTTEPNSYIIAGKKSVKVLLK